MSTQNGYQHKPHCNCESGLTVCQAEELVCYVKAQFILFLTGQKPLDEVRKSIERYIDNLREFEHCFGNYPDRVVSVLPYDVSFITLDLTYNLACTYCDELKKCLKILITILPSPVCPTDCITLTPHVSEICRDKPIINDHNGLVLYYCEKEKQYDEVVVVCCQTGEDFCIPAGQCFDPEELCRQSMANPPVIPYPDLCCSSSDSDSSDCSSCSSDSDCDSCDSSDCSSSSSSDDECCEKRAGCTIIEINCHSSSSSDDEPEERELIIHVPKGAKPPCGAVMLDCHNGVWNPCQKPDSDNCHSDQPSDCPSSDKPEIPERAELFLFSPQPDSRVTQSTPIIFGYSKGLPILIVDGLKHTNKLFKSIEPYDDGMINFKIISDSYGKYLNRGWHTYELKNGECSIKFKVYQTDVGCRYNPKPKVLCTAVKPVKKPVKLGKKPSKPVKKPSKPVKNYVNKSSSDISFSSSRSESIPPSLKRNLGSFRYLQARYGEEDCQKRGETFEDYCLRYYSKNN